MQIKAEEQALAEALVADFPGQALPLSVMAAVHKSHGDVQRAETLWKEALRIDSSQSDFYEQLGLVAQEQDELDRAVAYWQEGLKRNPRAPNLRWRLAYVQVQQGQLDGTVRLLQEECTLTPDAARNYFLLGQIHLKQNAYQKAKACYEKALELQPSYVNAHYGLGKVYTRLKQREKAGASMKAYQMLKARQDTSEERIILDEFPVARARAAGLYRRVAGFYDSREHGPSKEKLLRRAISLDPESALNWEKLATLHYQQNRFQTALEDFQRAGELDPKNPLYYLNIGMLYGATGQLSQAEVSFKEAVDRFPRYSLAYVELARFYLYHRTNLVQAQSLAGKAIALQPSAANYDLLARACEANGDRSAAVAAAEQALAMEPDNKRYRAFYAHLQSTR
jgi:tetratricopeptide (TPR) repeat protein